MKQDFLVAVQAQVARSAIGPSTLRRQGAVGTVDAARGFLSTVPLRGFAVADDRRFRNQLDQVTEELRASLPRGAQTWGTARKALNVFLRDAMYCVYLDEVFRLRRAEQLLELPLDSITSKCLRKAATLGELPLWPGVRALRQDISDAFQAVASRVAAERGLARVHLDAFWWGKDRSDAV
jgi:hypothetical protein